MEGEKGVPPLRDIIGTVEAESVVFDVITLTPITKDPVRQCVRCHRVTAIAPENDEEWCDYENNPSITIYGRITLDYPPSSLP